MKRCLILSVLAVLVLVLVTSTLAEPGKVASQVEVTPAASPTPASAETHLEWESLNGPYERVTYALAVAPRVEKSSLLYAGTWGHGVYRSTNGGDTWKPRGIGGGRYIRALAASSFYSRTIYAGSSGEGLFRSTDGGKRWEKLGSAGLFTQPSVESRARNPLYIESILLIPGEGTEKIAVGTHNGVWVSDDQGNTWNSLNSGFVTDEDCSVQALAYDPAGWLYAGTLNGLYGRQDGDQTWRFLGPPDGYPDEARRILSLAVVTDTTGITNTLLIGTQGAGVYTLDIESQAWFTRTTGFPEDERARTIQVLLSTPNGMVYAGMVDYGVFETGDRGQTWEEKAAGLPADSLSVLSLARDPADGILYAGTYGDGVYQLNPGGDEEIWEPANDELPVDFPVQKIVFAGPDGERLLAGLRVGGMYLSTDWQKDEPTWGRLPTSLPIGPARDVTGLTIGGPDRDTVVIAASKGVFRSTDAGRSWAQVTSGLPAGDVLAKGLAQGRRDPQVLYVALADEVGIYRSADAGATWEPARGDLGEEVVTQVSCLTVGDTDETVYLGLLLGEVYVTRNAGATWQPLSRISDQDVLELEWSQRTAWSQFLHGGERRMLYARTTDGVYVSYDGGESWRLRMRGPFRIMWADPYRPGVVYAALPAIAIEKEFAPTAELPPDLWISYDGGETWTWAGRGPSSGAISALALNPRDAEVLYAGTEGEGVFRARLPQIRRSYTARATIGGIILTVALVLCMTGGIYVVQTGHRLGRPYGLPLRTWPALALLSARHADEVGLVSNFRTPLTPLERLTLALAPDEPFRSETMRQRLETVGAPTTLAQLDAALNNLALDYRLLHHSERDYRLAWSLLGQMAHARFWDSPTERFKLLEEVRRESHLRADTRNFFTRAGFDTSVFEVGFKVSSGRPEHALLGAEQGIYVHLHGAMTVDEEHIEQVLDGASRTYDGQLGGRVVFLVVSGPPHVDAYRRIARLRRQEDLRIVLLSCGDMRHAADVEACRLRLNQNLKRVLGNQDLFRLDEPARNLLDFFGHGTVLEKLAAACREGQVVGLGGMAGVGKTSLAWQVMERLPQAIHAWIDLTDARDSGLYAVVRQKWLIGARLRFPQWEQPGLESLPEQPTVTQIQNDLTGIGESLRSQALPGHLAVVLDGLTGLEAGSQEILRLTQAIASTENVSLLGVFDTRPRDSALFRTSLLRLFEPATTARMIDSLAVQMALSFDPSAVERLHQASGGHPLLLRQLASLTVAQGSSSDGQIGATDVESTISQYVAQPDTELSYLWDSLTEEEQQGLRSAIGARPSRSGEQFEALIKLGWLHKVDGRWQLFSHALERWLDSHPPAQ